MTDPWAVYLARLDGLFGEDVSYCLDWMTIRSMLQHLPTLMAEVRRLRGTLHTLLMMEGGPGVTGCPPQEGCRICEEVRGALAVPPPEEP